ncbi:MAG TPA: PepSY-like domain-containing protein [Chitinophagaceae bacterium]
MNSKLLMLAAGLSIGVLACNDASTGSDANKDSTVTTTTTSTARDADNTRVVAEVPAATKTSFEAKYPNATNVRWTYYEPEDRSTLDPSDWNYSLDTNDYVVRFNWDNADYYAWYDDGNWVRASTPVSDHAKLPAAVNDAIRNQFAGYKIVEVDKEHDKDRVTYEVDLEKGEDKIKATFDENGTVVKKKSKIDGQKEKEKVDNK